MKSSSLQKLDMRLEATNLKYLKCHIMPPSLSSAVKITWATAHAPASTVWTPNKSISRKQKPWPLITFLQPGEESMQEPLLLQCLSSHRQTPLCETALRITPTTGPATVQGHRRHSLCVITRDNVIDGVYFQVSGPWTGWEDHVQRQVGSRLREESEADQNRWAKVFSPSRSSPEGQRLPSG